MILSDPNGNEITIEKHNRLHKITENKKNGKFKLDQIRKKYTHATTTHRTQSTSKNLCTGR